MGGEGFWVEYTGDEELEWHQAYGTNEVPLLWVYGFPDVSPADGEGDADLWWPVMPEDSTSNPAVFPLVRPGRPEGKAGLLPAALEDPWGGRLPSEPGSKYQRPIHSYYFVRHIINRDDPDWMILGNFKLITRWTIRDLIHFLPANLQSHATTETSGRLAMRGWAVLPTDDISAYSAFHYHTTYVAGYYRRLYPMLSYVYQGPKMATEATIAHEVGHYFTHVFFGDDPFEQFSDSQLLATHDIGDEHASRPMLEEYAMYVDYLMNGNILRSLDVEEPHVLFVKSPEVFDLPALEGYATCLLARLHTGSSTIKGLSGATEDIPVVAAGHADLLGVLFGSKPTSVNELLPAIRNYLAQSGKQDLLPAIMERSGWSYHGDGFVLDQNAHPVPGAQVQAVCKTTSSGNREYMAPLQPVTTGSDGKFTLPRIFPGTHWIRVTTGSTTQEFAFTVDPNLKTSQKISIGALTLQDSVLDKLKQMTWIGAISCNGEFDLDNGGMEVDLFTTGYQRVHEASWSGNELTWVYADSSAYFDTVSGEEIICSATFSNDGRTLTRLECHMDEWQRFQGDLTHTRESDMVIEGIPLSWIDTQTPGSWFANFDLHREEIAPAVVGISFVEKYYQSTVLTITATAFRWTGSTMPGWIGFSLKNNNR